MDFSTVNNCVSTLNQESLSFDSFGRFTVCVSLRLLDAIRLLGRSVFPSLEDDTESLVMGTLVVTVALLSVKKLCDFVQYVARNITPTPEDERAAAATSGTHAEEISSHASALPSLVIAELEKFIAGSEATGSLVVCGEEKAARLRDCFVSSDS